MVDYVEKSASQKAEKYSSFEYFEGAGLIQERRQPHSIPTPWRKDISRSDFFNTIGSLPSFPGRIAALRSGGRGLAAVDHKRA